MKLQELLDVLRDRKDLQMKSPGMIKKNHKILNSKLIFDSLFTGLTARINGKNKTLYMQGVASIEEKTRENLGKTLEDLGLSEGIELNVADITTPSTVVIKLKFQTNDVEMTS